MHHVWVYIEAWYLSGEGRGEVHAPGLNLSDYRVEQLLRRSSTYLVKKVGAKRMHLAQT